VNGIDPAQAKLLEKRNKELAAANTFEAIARKWHANKFASKKLLMGTTGQSIDAYI
jgi:hypothetical protein